MDPLHRLRDLPAQRERRGRGLAGHHTVYIKLCQDTSSNEEDDELLEFFPREARYRWARTDPYHKDGGRVRHYQNIKSDSCHATRVSFPQDLRGSLLGTDCLTTRTHGGYADFYTFTNPRTQTVTIDLENEGERLDTYLYLVRGSSITGSEVAHNDDYNGTRDSHLEQSLRAGTYTVVVTNYGRGRSRTGDYQLRIRAGSGCSVTAITEEETDGRWTTSDCESTRRPGAYVDYYTFEVTGTRTKRVQIDLDSREDSYLFLISGTSPAGTAYIQKNDDRSRYSRDARIRTYLSPGHYTIAATTYYEDATGTYRWKSRDTTKNGWRGRLTAPSILIIRQEAGGPAGYERARNGRGLGREKEV